MSEFKKTVHKWDKNITSKEAKELASGWDITTPIEVECPQCGGKRIVKHSRTKIRARQVGGLCGQCKEKNNQEEAQKRKEEIEYREMKEREFKPITDAIYHSQDQIIKNMISRRDYFASQAMLGIILKPGTNIEKKEGICFLAYLYADEMLAAREG